MIDLDYLAFLENILTEKRKERFLEVLKNRTNHFTIAIEDVFQLHNTSAVMRSCEVFGIQELNVIEEKFGKRIDKEIAMGAQKWVDVNRFNSVQDCIDTLQGKGYQIIVIAPIKSNDEKIISNYKEIASDYNEIILKDAELISKYEEIINNGRHAFLSAPHVSGMLEGGVNIVIDGHTIGAVGVSGVKSAEDAATAKAGIAAIL
jgi:hypothetical protein